MPALKSKAIRSVLAAVIAFATTLFLPRVAQALPSYARQTGLSCIACHTEFPILTDYGRQFKLSGYTLSSGQTDLPPIAVMLQPSFTQTNRDQPGGAAPHFGPNSNVALSQASLFYSGRLFGPYAETLFGPSAAGVLNKFGTFIQATYDGVERRFHWDNAEIRYADTGTLFGQPLTYGFYLNNNPGMQDPWNSTPVWGFPFSSSPIAPTPAAGTLIEQGLSQQVAGVGGYMMLANSVYLDVAGYHSLDAGFQEAMGIDPGGETQVPGLAPYWRLAYTHAEGNHSYEVGLFGLAADTYPGRDKSAGRDNVLDWGVDSEYQMSFGKSDLTALGSAIYESDRWGASQKLGNTSNNTDYLWSTKVTADYMYDKTYGGAISYFFEDGSRDSALYSDSPNGSPLSDGLVVQLNWMPLNKSGGPSFWPKSNVKFSIQYVIYNRFNGTTKNASDNNTLYLETWIMF